MAGRKILPNVNAAYSLYTERMAVVRAWARVLPYLAGLFWAFPAFAQLDAAIPTEQLNPLLKTFSILTAHRPYQGAASLKADESVGFELGVEGLMMRMPDDLIEATGDSSISFVPGARLHLAYGITKAVDVSVSGLWYLGTYFAGGGIKVKVFEPEEGPAFAVRATYNFTNLDFSSLPIQLPTVSLTGSDSTSVGIVLQTQALTSHVVMSKRMTWAEPYAYAGLEVATAISILTGDTTVTVEGLGSQTQRSSVASQRLWYYGIVAGTGVIFRIPYVGMKIALEGAYSSLGMPTLGTQIGVSF